MSKFKIGDKVIFASSEQKNAIIGDLQAEVADGNMSFEGCAACTQAILADAPLTVAEIENFGRGVVLKYKQTRMYGVHDADDLRLCK